MRRLTCLLAFAGLLGGCATTTPSRAPAPRHVPVLRANFPDPFVLPVDGRFIAYATNAGGRNVPMTASDDLLTWRPVADSKGQARDALPVLPGWARAGFTWAPEVLAVPGGYALYFTTSHTRLDVQCIGVATSVDPLGPFTSTAPEPIVCQPELGGTIDAHPYRDADGQLYLYYKNDGNNERARKPAQVWVQRMTPDGLRVTGESRPLLTNDTHWEWRVVEAPAMVRHDGRYTLFFSANHFGWETDQRLSNYGTGYASCAGPMGPCTDAPENPWLRSTNDAMAGCLSGPGHPAVFEARGRRYMAFHAWAATEKDCRKSPADARYMYVAPLGFEDGRPVLGPSLRPMSTAAR